MTSTGLFNSFVVLLPTTVLRLYVTLGSYIFRLRRSLLVEL